jgi:cob(I)alamin adenosyltransferase
MKDEMADIAELRKASSAIYLACHKDVAKDVSRILTGAADEIGRLRGALDTCRELREYDAKEIKRLRAALLVAQQWMPTPQQALVPSAKADAELVERALTGRKGDA